MKYVVVAVATALAVAIGIRAFNQWVEDTGLPPIYEKE